MPLLPLRSSFILSMFVLRRYREYKKINKTTNIFLTGLVMMDMKAFKWSEVQ